MSIRHIVGSGEEDVRRVSLLQKPDGVELCVNGTGIAFLQNSETLMIYEDRGGRYLHSVVLAGRGIRDTLYCFSKGGRITPR